MERIEPETPVRGNSPSGIGVKFRYPPAQKRWRWRGAA
jgi:hypothetical protein